MYIDLTFVAYMSTFSEKLPAIFVLTSWEEKTFRGIPLYSFINITCMTRYVI